MQKHTMAVDADFGYAEYEYAKYLMDKSPDDAKEYLRRAASHGSFQAEYTYGKMLFDEGKREDAKEWFERSARTDAWTQTRVGLLLYTHVTSDMQRGASAIVNNMMQQFLITEENNGEQ